MLFIPPEIENIIKNFEKNGYEAFVVGGCVRDMLMGIKPHDYDITTSAPPEVTLFIFPKTVPTGIKHGTVTIISDGYVVEATTYRSDGEYSDHRRPENVTFVRNLREDLERRDFTVNAIAYNSKEGIRDFFGGEKDIEKKILRTVGNAERRFTEDALRILRLFRFSSTLGFEIEEETLKAALKLSSLLKEISAERILSELKKTLLGKNPEVLEPLIKTGFLELKKSPDFEKIKALGELSLFTFFYSADADVMSSLERLKVSNKEKIQAKNMQTLINMPFPQTKSELKKMLFLSDLPSVNRYFEFQKIYYGKSIENVLLLLNEITENNEPYRICDLKIDGRKLIELGIRGEKIGQTLEKLRQEVVLDPTLNNKKKLIEKTEQLNRN